MDFYYTIEDKIDFEDKIKGSKFIAQAYPITTKEDALKIISEVKKVHFDATHNCYAYCLGKNGLDYRASDDGEPKGSAGNPILFAIRKYEVSDVLVVVTRYYGGTKLGKGGLARAYGDTAFSALSQSSKKQVDISIPVKVFTTYDDISIIKSLLDEYALSTEETYTDLIEIIAYIPKSKVKEFQDIIIQKTSDRAGSIIIDENY